MAMTLTGGRILDAVVALVNVANKPSIVLPMIAKKKLQLIHQTLQPVYEQLQKQQNALIQMYGEEVFSDPEKTKSTGQWSIPDEKSEKGQQFKTEYDAMRAATFEFPLLTPIQFEMLGNDPRGLEIRDFSFLGELVTEPKEQ